MILGPALRAAVDASLSWYDSLCAVHGVPCSIDDGAGAELHLCSGVVDISNDWPTADVGSASAAGPATTGRQPGWIR